MQLTFYIALPLLFLAVLVTTFFHYRRKRKQENNGKKGRGKADIGSSENLDSLHLFSGNKLANNENTTGGLGPRGPETGKQYMVLKKDFERLLVKFSTLLTAVKQFSLNQKSETMEKIQEEIQQTLQEQIDNLKKQYETEKGELLVQLQQLNRVNQILVEENEALADRLSAHSPDGENAGSLEEREEEMTELKTRVAEQEYLEEVVKEKKMQIDFLQNQLEQRIKSHHQAEQQYRELSLDFQNLKSENREVKLRFSEVKEELEAGQNEGNHLRSVIDEKEKENFSLQQVIHEKADQIVQLESVIVSLQNRETMLNISLEEKEQIINSLKENLSGSKGKINQAEQRLEHNQQLLNKFYKELSAILEGKPEPPVIIMKTDFSETNEAEKLSESGIQ